MRVLLDINVILDVLLDREPFAALSSVLVSHVETGKLEGYLCATSLTTMDYLLGKTVGKAQARQSIQTLLSLFQVTAVDKSVLQLAAHSEFKDFEDAVQHFSATTRSLDAIVTRNIRDFKWAECPVYTPQELLAILESQSDRN